MLAAEFFTAERPKLRHFIQTQDFSPAELGWLFQLIRLLKDADRDRAVPRLLEGASLGMIFEEPSTRTRVSFEVAMTKLGGHALYLRPGEIHLGVRESIADTARVISRMVDAVEIRALKHATITEFAKYSDVPVLNGLSDLNHPTQVVCDVFTMLEHASKAKGLKDLKVTFVGDATNVCYSLMLICTALGISFTHAAPKQYQVSEDAQKIARENAGRSGARFVVTDDPIDAVKDADFIYTDLWWWVGQEKEIPERTAAFMPKYQVNRQLLSHAPETVQIMHCLPASRGVEATDEVLDSKQSIIFDQAENRLHTEKALLVAFVYPRLRHPAPALKERHEGLIEDFLSN
ncbi:putrescine carbamoyltransferase [Methyloligella sp. GL2]|nr:putrescine carbamoyltransferase [Methyloligella sp. GL2]